MRVPALVVDDDSTRRSKRWLALVAVAVALDVIFIATSILHTLSERGVAVGFGFNSLHVEDASGVPSQWQVGKSGVVAAGGAIVILRTRRREFFPGILALALVAVSIATRFHEDLPGSKIIGAAVIGAIILGLAWAGTLIDPVDSSARTIGLALGAFVVVGGALGLLTDALIETFLQPVLSIVEGGVELLLLTLACSAVVDAIASDGGRGGRQRRSATTLRARRINGG